MEANPKPFLNYGCCITIRNDGSWCSFWASTRRWNPKMSKYIYCARNGVHIIDLVKTALCMNNAYKWTRNAAKSGKRFLFVGTKKQASDVVAQEATRCGAAYVNQRCLEGC